MSTNYVVVIQEFAKRHYIKSFEKKYKGAWEITQSAIIEEFKRFDSLLDTSIAETICEASNVRICKTEFRVHGTKESRKSSGNRCIVAVHKDINTVCVLLVYHHGDLGNKNETAGWKRIVKDNFNDYKELL